MVCHICVGLSHMNNSTRDESFNLCIMRYGCCVIFFWLCFTHLMCTTHPKILLLIQIMTENAYYGIWQSPTECQLSFESEAKRKRARDREKERENNTPSAKCSLCLWLGCARHLICSAWKMNIYIKINLSNAQWKKRSDSSTFIIRIVCLKPLLIFNS